MAKKQKEKSKVEEIKSSQQSYTDRINYEKTIETIKARFLKMRYADLQREAIKRGIDFNLLCHFDIGRLQAWIITNWENPIDECLISEFDNWRYQLLKDTGREGEPFVRLGYLGEINEETGDIDIIKPEKIKKPTEKRERDPETNIFKGTKKALTFECVKQGKTREETIAIVTSKFPDAKDKSIIIWMKRCKKAKE